jgi:hypothetical protein
MKVSSIFSDALYRIIKNDSFVFLSIFLLIILAYINIIFSPSTVSPDAGYILLYMEELLSLGEYFQKLITFQGIDFQPLRDLSLSIDLYIFRQTGWNLFIFTNCLIWSGCCFQLYKLSNSISSEERHGLNLILVMCFSVHPVFSQTIDWSMGRKHLLAVFFILWNTKYFLDYIQKKNNGNLLPVLYGMSLLSVPIALLWPIWASLTAFIRARNLFSKINIKLIPLYVIMITAGIINYAYYFSSSTYREIFIQKSASLKYSLIFHHLGQHLKQILFPSALRFHYRLDDSALWFFGALLILVSGLLVNRKKDSNNLVWLIFAGMSPALFLRTPEAFFDTYVLLPAVGLFLTCVRIPRVKPSTFKLGGVFILALITITIKNHPYWMSLRKFGQNNFHYNQDCNTARAYAESFYIENKKLPNDLYEFIQSHNCLEPLKGESPVSRRGIRNFESRMLLIEDEIDLDYRIERLARMGEENYYPKIVYGLLMMRAADNAELEQTMSELNVALGSVSTLLDYDPLITDELKSFCQRERLTECLRFTKRYHSKITQPFL